MGWWGHDIMGGDTPLDVKDRFEDELAGEYTPEKAIAFIGMLRAEWGCDYDEIIAQCIGWLVMHHGLPINDQLRALVIEGCDSDKSFEWVDTDERKKYVAELKSLVSEYPVEGRKTVMERSTVFSELFKKLDKLPNQ